MRSFAKIPFGQSGLRVRIARNATLINPAFAEHEPGLLQVDDLEIAVDGEFFPLYLFYAAP